MFIFFFFFENERRTEPCAKRRGILEPGGRFPPVWRPGASEAGLRAEPVRRGVCRRGSRRDRRGGGKAVAGLARLLRVGWLETGKAESDPLAERWAEGRRRRVWGVG